MLYRARIVHSSFAEKFKAKINTYFLFSSIYFLHGLFFVKLCQYFTFKLSKRAHTLAIPKGDRGGHSPTFLLNSLFGTLSFFLNFLFKLIWFTYTRGGEPIYYQGPYELCIIAGGPQNQLISS